MGLDKLSSEMQLGSSLLNTCCISGVKGEIVEEAQSRKGEEIQGTARNIQSKVENHLQFPDFPW